MPALPPTKPAGTHEQDLLVVNNVLKEDFTAQWGGQPFIIKNGERKIFPRFVAEHMAKHMADRYLLLEEKRRETEQGGKKLNYSLLNNKDMRTEAVNAILPEVYQYYLQQPNQTEEQKTAQRTEEANADADFNRQAADMGEVPNKALGTLSDKPIPLQTPPVPTMPQPPAPAGAPQAQYSMTDPKLPKPSVQQLREDADKLGIDYTEADSIDDLWAKIQAF